MTDDQILQRARETLDRGLCHSRTARITRATDTELIAFARAILAAKPAPDLDREALAGIVARGWCHVVNAAKAMDPDLASAIVTELTGTANLPRAVLQQMALDAGFNYWRAPDAHGITGTAEQATEFIRNCVGVEVEITDGPGAMPAGWKAAPLEPTLTMAAAGRTEFNRWRWDDPAMPSALYRAMLSAARPQ